jgi:hypothetical protein
MTQIFRITHRNNLPFILQNGLLCPNANVKDPHFEPIGFPTLIDYRKDRQVPVAPGGTLADYVPFYFWYKSPMLYVIHQGNDPEVIKTAQEDIVYVVSSFESLISHHCQFVFTDRHAKLEYANFFTHREDVSKLDWGLIQTDEWGRQFGAERKEMKQAECLVHQKVPVEAIIGIAVHNQGIQEIVNQQVLAAKLNIPIKILPKFYF